VSIVAEPMLSLTLKAIALAELGSWLSLNNLVARLGDISGHRRAQTMPRFMRRSSASKNFKRLRRPAVSA
jgi:hypothetical protein